MKPLLLLATALLLDVMPGSCSCGQREPPVRPDPEGGETACTEDAKICPDGSAVGRSGPRCEHAPCPAAPPPDGSGRFATPPGAP